jgi:hypothetical protein
MFCNWVTDNDDQTLYKNYMAPILTDFFPGRNPISRIYWTLDEMSEGDPPIMAYDDGP